MTLKIGVIAAENSCIFDQINAALVSFFTYINTYVEVI